MGDKTAFKSLNRVTSIMQLTDLSYVDFFQKPCKNNGKILNVVFLSRN
jgi:hypothetical protein